MRILLVSDFFPPTQGGLEAHVQRLAVALIQRGHSLAVVTSTLEPDPLPQGTSIISSSTVLGRVPYLFQEKDRAFPPPWPDTFFRKTVRKVAASWKPDVIHAHGWCSFSCYWRDSPPLVVSLHDHGLRCPKKSLLRKGVECHDGQGAACVRCPGDQTIAKRLPMAIALNRYVQDLAANASQFIAVSQSVAKRVNELGFANSKISVIPNFIDFSEPRLCSRLGQPTILFIGPDSPHKGRSVAIDAFQRLPNGFARLHLVGNGAEIKVPGVRNLGYLSGIDLVQQFQTASVLVIPSIWPEPCPTVVLEAMTYGLPVIGSRIGGIPDLVVHGETGLLVPPNDPYALANCMFRLLNDRRMCNTMGLNAKVAVANFSTDAVVPEIEKVYSSVIRMKSAA
jgi:glycosyltransferase involved in cell wall biosynthesis